MSPASRSEPTVPFTAWARRRQGGTSRRHSKHVEVSYSKQIPWNDAPTKDSAAQDDTARDDSAHDDTVQNKTENDGYCQHSEADRQTDCKCPLYQTLKFTDKDWETITILKMYKTQRWSNIADFMKTNRHATKFKCDGATLRDYFERIEDAYNHLTTVGGLGF